MMAAWSLGDSSHPQAPKLLFYFARDGWPGGGRQHCVLAPPPPPRCLPAHQGRARTELDRPWAYYSTPAPKSTGPQHHSHSSHQLASLPSAPRPQRLGTGWEIVVQLAPLAARKTQVCPDQRAERWCKDAGTPCPIHFMQLPLSATTRHQRPNPTPNKPPRKRLPTSTPPSLRPWNFCHRPVLGSCLHPFRGSACLKHCNQSAPFSGQPPLAPLPSKQ